MDQKSIFDAGYRSYEDGNREGDFAAASATWPDKAQCAATWRAGWQRGREDSVLPRYGQA
ncbi:MAG: hypothetical protein WCO00_10015 [Rhodospirillaceae bacterium]